MVTRTIAEPVEAEGQHVGQVFADISVENSGDLDARGTVLRSVLLGDVVLDSGATHLCLPAGLIAQLGLPLVREAPVRTATGIEIRRIFRHALVRFEDRDVEGYCVELPAGSPPLLGAIPMEGMGIEPDLQNRRVRKLPLGPDGTYITA